MIRPAVGLRGSARRPGAGLAAVTLVVPSVPMGGLDVLATEDSARKPPLIPRPSRAAVKTGKSLSL